MTLQQPSPDSRSAVSKIILIATAVVGGVALLTAGATAAAQAVGQSWSGPNAASDALVDVDGVTAVELDIDAADVTVVFDAVDEVSIEATGSDSENWRLARSADKILISTPREGFALCFGLCGTERTALVRLPHSLEGIDLDIDVDAGSVTADGTFRDLDIDGDAGATTVRGEARSIEVELDAGSLDARLDGVRQASFAIAAGRAQATLTGPAPDRVDAEVSAGALDLVLPDTAYRVHSEVTLGDFVNDLRTDKASKHRIEVELEAGSIALRAGEKPTQESAR